VVHVNPQASFAEDVSTLSSFMSVVSMTSFLHIFDL
jgi:hypothetical protein